MKGLFQRRLREVIEELWETEERGGDIDVLLFRWFYRPTSVKILDVLMEAYPDPVSLSELTVKLGKRTIISRYIEPLLNHCLVEKIDKGLYRFVPKQKRTVVRRQRRKRKGGG